jgi:catechol 2,3-dioxygenase-like lactoylglutathione lyase family enzyme
MNLRRRRSHQELVHPADTVPGTVFLSAADEPAAMTAISFGVADMDHTAIRVADIDRALEFYHGQLGLPVRDREGFEAGELPFVAVVAGGRHLHLVPTDEPFDPGSEHVCLLLRCDDTDTRDAMGRLLTELRAAGIEVLEDEPIERLGTYGRDWSAYVRDPDGRIVELKLH